MVVNVKKFSVAALSFLVSVEITQMIWDVVDLSSTVHYHKKNRNLRVPKRKNLNRFSDGNHLRDLSINLGGGECLWTPAQPISSDAEVFGTLLAAYPGSGMRLAWQHAESLTGIAVGDDYNLSPDFMDRSGIIKTQYPHLEGIWSWGDKMDQVVLVVRNPRWAFPSYHDLLAEIHYAYDWENVYQYMSDIFTKHASLDDWKQWRDYRFHEEILLYKFYIDYWMEGGKQYWMELDFERIGERPFSWVNETEREIDTHCIEDMNCEPKAVIDYDLLKDPVTGTKEVAKLAAVLDGKLGIKVIEEEARHCIWHQTDEILGIPDDRREGPDPSEYTFTYAQFIEMRDMLEEMQYKYSSGIWVNNAVARDLAGYFGQYIEAINPEIEELEANRPPTAAPNEQYEVELKAWYDSLGKGDRYGQTKMQERQIWPLVKDLYEEN